MPAEWRAGVAHRIPDSLEGHWWCKPNKMGTALHLRVGDAWLYCDLIGLQRERGDYPMHEILEFEAEALRAST